MAISQRSTGVLITAAFWNELVDAINLLDASTSTITTTGTQTALAIPGGLGDLAIFANNASLLTVQGIAAGLDGQRLTIHSIGAGQVDLVHQNGSASAANRLVNCATSGNTQLAAGSGKATYQYDLTATRWRLVTHEQGAWITPTFSAGDFTGNGSMTWTVASGDRIAYASRLNGRTMSVHYSVQTSTVGGTLNTALQVKIPGGFTAAGAGFSVGYSVDSGAAAVPGYVQVSGTNIQHFKNITFGGNWAAATDTTGVQACITLEVA